MDSFITRIRTENGSHNGDYVMSAAPTRILGKADSGSPVTIVIRDEDGNPIRTFETTAERNGFFRLDPGALPDGAYTIEVTALRGGVLETAGTEILIDTATEAPHIKSVTSQTEDGNNLLEFAGTAEANAIVSVFAAGVLIGTARADANGLWTLTVDGTGKDLSGFTAEATDAAGNTANSALEDDGERPVFEAGQAYSYRENQIEGNVLAKVAASDNVGIAGYAIVAGNEFGWFEIDITGAIRLTKAGLEAAANDFETGSNTFVLTIRVSDASGNSTTENITLELENAIEADDLLATANVANIDDIRREIYEDSSSDGYGQSGSRNGVWVTLQELSQIAQDVFKFADDNGDAALGQRFQNRITTETGFSNLPTDAEIQELVDRANSDFSGLFAFRQGFNEAYVVNWDVSLVKNMAHTFMLATSFDQDIGNWDVSSVVNMEVMFGLAKGFNQDIGAWDVSNVRNMFAMFLSSDADSERNTFDQNLGGWDISSLENAGRMLDYNTNFSTENFDMLLAGWGTLDTAAGETNINTGVALGAEGLTYTDVTSKNHLEQTYGWTVGGSQAATDSDGRTIFAGDNTGTVIDLSGESQAQAIHGLDGNDTILGTAFDDLIVGGAGDDVMTGGAGADKFVFRDYGGGQGDFGHDTIRDFAAGAGDVIRLELTGLTNFADLLTKASDATRDGTDGVLIQIDADNSIFLEGLTINELSEDDFEFVATDSQTFKLGSYGNDTLAGDDHNNRIDGRSGDDTLSGGEGEDTFVYKEGYENDTISDFDLAEDLIEIDAGLAADFTALLAMMGEENGGADTVIDFGNGDTLTLEGVSMSNLTGDEFSFL